MNDHHCNVWTSPVPCPKPGLTDRRSRAAQQIGMRSHQTVLIGHDEIIFKWNLSRFEVRLLWALGYVRALSSRQCEHILPAYLCYHVVQLLPGYPSSSSAKVAWYQFSENEIQPLRTVTMACSNLGMFGRVWKAVSAVQPDPPRHNGRRSGCEGEYQALH